MKYLERAYSWLLIAPVILPVVIWGEVVYPYLVPKTLLFYAFMLIAVGVFAILLAHGRSFYWARLKRTETWIPGALLALAYGASAAGLGFYHSLWSVFVRGDGLLMLTGVVVSFYLILLETDKQFFDKLMRAVAVVGTFVAVYGIGEFLFFGASDRVGGLLGNAAFFAGYLAIAFFATLISAQDLSLGWRRAAYVGAALELIAVIISATRGSILALGLAGVMVLFYIAFCRTESAEASKVALRAARPSLTTFATSASSVRTFARAALLVLIVAGGLFFVFRTELAHAPFEPLARIASIGLSDNDTASRLFIWKNMLGQIAQSPWLGVGAEHIDAVFNRFYDPTQIVEQWFDRSHNAFLDYAVQYGIGGLLLYLGFIFSFFTAAFRLYRRDEKVIAGLAALLALTYSAQNFFVFDTISSFWLFAALLAVVLARSYPGASRESFPLPGYTRPLSWLAGLVLAALIIPVSILPMMAAYDLAQAYHYQLTDPAREISFLSHGVALGTYGDIEYGYEVYEMYTSHQLNYLSGTTLVDVYKASLAILTNDFNAYPYDARTALYLAHVLSLAPPGVAIDDNLLSSALERTIRLSPKRSQPWYILVNLSLNQANANPPGSAERTAGYAAAKDILTHYIALVPTLAEPHFVLAELELAAGDAPSATTEAALGKRYYTSDLETALRAVTYYETVRDLPDAAFFLNDILRMDPTNISAAEDLAKINAYEQSAQ